MLLEDLAYHVILGTLSRYLKLRMAVWKHRRLRDDLWYFLEEIEPYMAPFRFEIPLLAVQGFPMAEKLQEVYLPTYLEPNPTLERFQRQYKLIEVAGVLLRYQLLDPEHVPTLERALQEMLDTDLRHWY